MVDPLVVGGCVATVALLACSAFFSSSETAIFSLPTDHDAVPGDDDPSERTLTALREDPHRLLVTLLVGNNVVNVAISSIITVLVARSLPPGPAVLAATVVTSSLVLVFGEIVPKAYGLGNAPEWSLTVAPAVALVERFLSPLISLFDWVTRGINRVIEGESDIERPYLE
jgi:CBS domain containing-hemolysin-like protein